MGNTTSSETTVVPLQAPAQAPVQAPAQAPVQAPVQAPAPDWVVALTAMNPEEKRTLFAELSVDYKKELANIKTERDAQAKGIVNVEDDVTYDQLQNENTKINADVFLNIKAYNYRTEYTEENKRNIQKRIWFNINYLQFEKWKYIQEVRIVRKRFGNNFPNVPSAIKNEFPEIYKIQEEKREKNRKRQEEKLLL